MCACVRVGMGIGPEVEGEPLWLPFPGSRGWLRAIEWAGCGLVPSSLFSNIHTAVDVDRKFRSERQEPRVDSVWVIRWLSRCL